MRERVIWGILPGEKNESVIVPDVAALYEKMTKQPCPDLEDATRRLLTAFEKKGVTGLRTQTVDLSQDPVKLFAKAVTAAAPHRTGRRR
jgi:hypothetical protein